MTPKIKKLLTFVGIELAYILIVWLIGFDWLYFGTLLIADAFYWHFVMYRSKRGPKKKKTIVREWTDAIIFAVVAATIIRTFFFEAYTIPTPSMEKSMMVGDFLFVSKMHYGPKVPNTPLSFPFVHNTLPGTEKTKSYLEWIQWDYHRLPGFADVKNNDIVVFNYPMDENVPVDKKTNYIKRCIAVPGDSLKIVDLKVFVNGKEQPLPDRGHGQFMYYIRTKTPFHPKVFQQLGIYDFRQRGNEYQVWATEEDMATIKGYSNVEVAQAIIAPQGEYDERLFPSDPNRPWNIDNYGSIWIPKAGVAVSLDSASLPIFERIITEYEGNQLEVKPEGIFVNGELAESYTFKYNYYWMMGDNRHNSQDSRFWGFVPEDHIVGKAVFVWFSWDSNAKGFFNKVRWNRVMTVIHGDGQATSLLPYILAIIAFFIGRKQYRIYKSKKAA